MKNPHAKTILALLLCAALLLPLASIPATANSPAQVRVALISDVHYFPEELAGGYNDAFKESNIIGQPVEQVPGLLRSALAAIKARSQKEKIDYLLISGDLTNTGEYISHIRLAEILGAFEKETGISVAVAPGNHDIDYGSREFTTGVRRDAQKTYPEDFLAIYAQLGYDLPGLERFPHTGEDRDGMLTYAADLGKDYRLIAIDTSVRRINPDLRAWEVGQCEAAVKAGKTVIGMGHHNLNEAFNGQLTVMQGEGIENMREISEEFADAGMHFYFSGHLHMGEISPWYSDSGEVLYDIVVPGLWTFPGDYRVVSFSAAGGRIEADVRSYPVDDVLPVTTNGITYPQPYYPTGLKLTFGYEGEGLAGFLKANAKKGLTDQLSDLRKNGGLTEMVKGTVDFLPLNALMRYLDIQLINRPEKIVELVNGLVDDVFALPVSKLPCTRFIDELGFGDAKKPGTLEDAGNSLLAYMFWKMHDSEDDAFMQDVLRRMQNGELIDQVLNFAVPKILDVLGAEVLPLLANVDIALLNRALRTALAPFSIPLLLLLALVPGMRDTISAMLYDLAGEIVKSQSPTGRADGMVVYDGKAVSDGLVPAPTGPKTFRLPYDLSVTTGGFGRGAEITWYTKRSLTSPQVKLTDRAGNAVEGLSITYSSEPAELMVDELDLGIMQMMGQKLFAMKHTAKVEGLGLLSTYNFTAGDSEFGWWSAPQKLAPTAQPVWNLFGRIWAWFFGMLRLPGIMWRNRGF